MGCEIHLQVERRKDGKWAHVPTYSFRDEGREGAIYIGHLDGRDYRLFAALAGVRNYDGVPPISEPRGLPEDADPATLDSDVGDHSQSWLTLAELEPLKDSEKYGFNAWDWRRQALNTLGWLGDPADVRFVFGFDS